MPCHHNLESYLLEYIDGAGFRVIQRPTCLRRTAERAASSPQIPLPQTNAYAMIQRLARAADITTKIGNHTSRANGRHRTGRLSAPLRWRTMPAPADPGSDQRHHQLVENRREIRRRNQRTHIRHAKLGRRSIVDGQVRLPIQARRVDNAVRRGRMLMESQRPGSAQSLRRRARDIARDAHPDSAIATKIDERKRRGDFDLYVTPNVELPLIHGIVADSAVAAIAQHRLQEADLERFAEIDDAKSMGGDASTGIAEAAWRLAKPQRVRVAIEDNSTKSCARVDRRQMQRGAIERRPRVGSFRHSGERLGDAFRRFDDVGRPALAKRVAARLAI